MSEPIKSLKGLENKFKKAKSGVSDDTIFSANALMFVATEIVEMNKILKKIAKKRGVTNKKWYEFWK